MRPEAASNRLPEIEVLRACAVAAVVLCHAHGNLVLRPHHVFDWLIARTRLDRGVDLFFAISGFVISRALLPQLAACRRRGDFITVAMGFWIRRAWRLLPSAWLWLVIILAASLWFNQSGAFMSPQANAWAMLAGVFDFANFRMAQTMFHTDYGASFAWWSLSLEEQFYLLLPPCAYLAGRFLPLAMLGVLFSEAFRLRTMLMVLTRTDAILLGCLLAMAARMRGFHGLGARLAPIYARGLAVVAAVALVTVGVGDNPINRYAIITVALLSTGLVYLACQDRGLLIADGWPRRLLCAIGARSFGLYLIHIPAFCAAREIFFRNGAPRDETIVALTGIALLLFASELNWRFVEQPLRDRGRHVAARFAARRLILQSASLEHPHAA